MLDKQKIANNFSKSATDYEKHAGLQQGMADSLFQSIIRFNPKNILDIGSGTGYLANKLARQFPAAKVTGIDISAEMVRVAKERYARNNLTFMVGDAEEMILSERSFDLVVSNASFQWMDLSKVAKKLSRLLVPGGQLIFSTFGPGTLEELRYLGFRVNRLPSVQEIKKILNQDFIDIKFTTEARSLKFDNLKAAIHHLKNIGAQTTEGISGQKLKISALKKIKGKISVTFEIIYCFARKR